MSDTNANLPLSKDALIHSMGKTMAGLVTTASQWRKRAEEAEIRLAEVEAANRWIPCSERMPEDEVKVDVWSGGEFSHRVTDVFYGWSGGSEGYWGWHFADGMDEGEALEMHGYETENITHWRYQSPAPSTMNETDPE